MTDPLTVLLAMYDGGGNVPPLLAVAEELVERGNRVIVLAGPFFGESTPCSSLLERAAASGCEVRIVPFGEEPSPTIPPVRGLIFGRTGRWFGPLQFTHSINREAWRWADATAEVCRSERADVVAADDMLPGALIGAEAVGVPFFSLMHTIYFFRTAPGLPPPGMGFDQASKMPHHVRDWAIKKVIFRVHSRDALPGINAARDRLGLRTLRHPWEQYDAAENVLVLSSPHFDFRAKRLPENVVYTGMPFARSSIAASTVLQELASRPVVLVSLSTSNLEQAETAQAILDALADLPVRTVITVTGTLTENRLSLPPNAEATGFRPHAEVLPSVSAVVSHGGHGTVMTALTHGKPVICTPLFFDQFDIARRLHSSGAGIDVGRKPDKRSIRSAVEQVLSDPSFAMRAQNIAERMSGERGRERAADIIEGSAAVRANS